MSHHVQVVADHPQNRRERAMHVCMHTHMHPQRDCVCMPACYQLSGRVVGCLRFWIKFSGFSRSGFSPPFMALAAICQHVSSQVQLPLVWVKLHPLHMACRVLLIFTQGVWRIKYVRALLFTFFFSHRYIIFCKHKGGKVVDEVMKFSFHN